MRSMAPGDRNQGWRRISPTRIFWVLAFAACGYFSLTASLADSLARMSPARAYLLAPWNGQIAGQFAQQQASKGVIGGDTEDDAVVLALHALEKDPTVAGAVSVLALKAQLDGDVQQTRDLFQYSLALSRRELQARLWAIEEAVQRGDLDETLRNYDIALRTSKSSFELLYPILASSLDETAVRSRVLTMLETDPPWDRTFIDFVASSGIKPRAAIAFFSEGRELEMPVTDENRVVLTDILYGNGMAEDAWAFFSSFRPNAERAQLRNGAFTYQIDQPTVFDWRLNNSEGLSSSMRPNPNGGFVEFSAGTGLSGDIMRQALILPQGRYILTGSGEINEQPRRSLPYWLLRCSDGREIASVDISNGGGEEQKFFLEFNVAPNCPTQELVLVARASDQFFGVDGKINTVELRSAP